MAISLTKAQQAEQQLMDLVASTYADPLRYVLAAFPWGVEGTPLAKHGDGPDKWHRDLFAYISDQVVDNHERRRRGDDMVPVRVAIASGHGIGKSACVAWLIHWLMSTRVNLRGIVTANTENQLQTKTWPELGKWKTLALNGHWFEWTATRFAFAAYDEDRKKNYCMDAIPWSETRSEAFAGLHNETSAVCYIFDEASAIPDKISEVASGGLTDGEPFWFKFGNPTRNSGDFYECFHRNKKYWWTRNIDSRSVRITNKTYLNELIDQYGIDSYEARVRILGQFPRESSTQFISTSIVEEAQARKPAKDLAAPLIMGVDVARQGDDRTVFFFRRGDDATTIDMRTFTKMDTMQTAARVVEFATIHNPDYIIVDGVGVGGGVVDRIRQLGFKVVEVNGGASADDKRRYANKRAEMWGRMKEWLANRGAIPDNEDLRQELTAPEYRYSSSQQIQLERKEDFKKRLRKSPDLADALSLTFAVKTAHKDLAAARRAAGRRERVAEGVDYRVLG